MRRLLAALCLAVLACPSAFAQEPRAGRATGKGPTAGSFTLGGSFGLGFGSVNWVALTGEVGYLPTDRLWVGTSGTFRYTDDTRFDPSFHAVDYGIGVFGRYFVFDRFFADTEWSWTSYETRLGDSTTVRSSTTSLFLGAGYGQAIAGRSIAIFEVLYDVTGNANGLYGTPWLLRAGFTIGF